jgi:nucleoid DNA-binding protein
LLEISMSKSKLVPHRDFIAVVKKLAGANSNDAAQHIATSVIDALVFCAGEGTLVLRGFGTFKTVLRAARHARNPLTNQPVLVPARETLVFKSSDLLRKG